MRKYIRIYVFIFSLIVVMHGQDSVAGLDVAVSIPPQKWLCQKLGGKHITTKVLVNRGQDPHTFEPTPKQMVSLLKAKLYFTLGLEFETQILKKINQASSSLEIIDTSLRGREEKHDDIDEDHHDEDHHVSDPHIWLSPPFLKEIAVVMAEAIIQADSANRHYYEKNLESLLLELSVLHDTIQQKLLPFRGASFYVFHPSFGQFAKTYGLTQEAVETEGKAPSPKQLATLITRARKEKVHVIFVQPQFDAKSAMAVANAIQGEVVPLDAMAEDVSNNLKLMSEKIVSALEEKSR